MCNCLTLLALIAVVSYASRFTTAACFVASSLPRQHINQKSLLEYNVPSQHPKHPTISSKNMGECYRQKRLSLFNGDAGFDSGGTLVVPLVVALGLGVAAQGWINTMLKGDDGLGAFLKDGRGYQNSAFRPSSSASDKKQDPLPWLSLPKLDFVEVAGQDAELEQQLEAMRRDMNRQLEAGNIQEATSIRQELEFICKENGFEYQSDDI